MSEKIIRRKLAEYGAIGIFTPQCGYMYELFKPIEKIAVISPHLTNRIRVLAVDPDAHGILEAELMDRAKQLGISLKFVKGDLSSPLARAAIQQSAPYDFVQYIGLSYW